jgi:hypothetical protein
MTSVTPSQPSTQATCIAQLSYDQIAAGEFPTEPLARRVFRQAVAEVAQRAKAALPSAINGRLEKAVQLVLAGDVSQVDPNTFEVASGSEPTASYIVAFGQCPCPDTQREALGGWCQHRLASAIYARAKPLTTQRLDAADWLEAAPTPEAPAPQKACGIPAQFVTEIQGRQFVTYNGLLAMAHERGLQSLKADFISVTAELALAHAVATFQDGRTFEESGDATPANVNKRIAPHFARLALTRAKARALRDALNISMVAVEELAE